MTDWIALLRGINVGGHRKVPMQALATLLRDDGCEDVSTYIQSGNVVFRHKEKSAGKLSARLRAAIARRFGFEPDVLVLTSEEFAAAADANPFPQACSEPTSLHLWFFPQVPANPDLDALSQLKKEDEMFELRGKVFYLRAWSGIGTSKVAPKVERLIGVSGTARNWRTVSKLCELADRLGAD